MTDNPNDNTPDNNTADDDDYTVDPAFEHDLADIKHDREARLKARADAGEEDDKKASGWKATIQLIVVAGFLIAAFIVSQTIGGDKPTL